MSADLEVSFRGLLVGCGHELNSLTAADLELVEERLKEEAISRLRLMDTYMELEESRRELVGDINRSLGHKAIRDVYFFDFEFVEFEPRLGSPKPK